MPSVQQLLLLGLQLLGYLTEWLLLDGLPHLFELLEWLAVMMGLFGR